MLRGKLEICIQERPERSECKENKNKSRRRGGKYFLKPQCRLKEAESYLLRGDGLVGRRSEESQRVPGWSGW